MELKTLFHGVRKFSLNTCNRLYSGEEYKWFLREMISGKRRSLTKPGFPRRDTTYLIWFRNVMTFIHYNILSLSALCVNFTYPLSDVTFHMSVSPPLFWCHGKWRILARRVNSFFENSVSNAAISNNCLFLYGRCMRKQTKLDGIVNLSGHLIKVTFFLHAFMKGVGWAL